METPIGLCTRHNEETLLLPCQRYSKGQYEMGKEWSTTGVGDMYGHIWEHLEYLKLVLSGHTDSSERFQNYVNSSI